MNELNYLYAKKSRSNWSERLLWIVLFSQGALVILLFAVTRVAELGNGIPRMLAPYDKPWDNRAFYWNLWDILCNFAIAASPLLLLITGVCLVVERKRGRSAAGVLLLAVLSFLLFAILIYSTTAVPRR